MTFAPQKYWHDATRSEAGFRYVVFDGQIPAFGADGYATHALADEAGRDHANRLQAAWNAAPGHDLQKVASEGEST